MRDHRKLRAFQEADRLVIAVYDATRCLPQNEAFGLTSQLRRAAVSVVANIVEGSARPSEKDYRHFLSVAFASLRELGYLLDLSVRLGLLPKDQAEPVLTRQNETALLLGALLNRLSKSRPVTP